MEATPVAVGEALDAPLAAAVEAVRCRAPSGVSLRAKRGLDLVVASLLLVALSPLIALVVLLIRAVDGGPAIFWQKRVGQDTREFWFPKFRSMRNGAEHLRAELLKSSAHPDSVTFKMENDPRVTPIGRVIRTLSVDELPQLWCVLTGDMSMVGPRPPLPDEVEQYSDCERRRLEIRPGLTCIWQVSGRSMIPFPDQVTLDIAYIERQTLWLDLKLLALTIPAVLSCKGAY